MRKGISFFFLAAQHDDDDDDFYLILFFPSFWDNVPEVEIFSK